jgi:putative transposase
VPRQFERLAHALYECKYHIEFCPKYRYRILTGEMGEYVKQELYQLCRQKDGVEVLVFNRYDQLRRQYRCGHLWSRGYCVSTIGLDEEKIRKYVKWQEGKDQRDETHQKRLFD